MFQLRLVHGRPGIIHSLDEFETSELTRELGAVERAIGVEPNGNTLYRLPSGVYVHCYGESIDFKLQDASHFFEFDNSLPITLASGSMDIRPFLFGGEDLVLFCGGANSTKYPWVTDPKVAWDWGEGTWSSRLSQVLQAFPLTQNVRVIEAFKWMPNSYTSEVSTLFPRVMGIRAALFRGMTDIIIMGKSSISVVNLPVLCSIEIGDLGKQKTTEVPIASELKRWPEKVGELMASMYLFGTLNFLNHLTGMPGMVKFETYGVLAMRGVVSLLLKMTLDNTECRVSLIHEEGTLALGNILEYVIKTVSGS